MPGGVAFGAFELDLQDGELYKHGIRVRLRGQSVQILAALVASPGQLVSREELEQRLWPGVRYADFNSGLNSAVNRLRDALGDSAAEPRYIETVPGRGYRFIAPVTTGQAQAGSGTGAPRNGDHGSEPNGALRTGEFDPLPSARGVPRQWRLITPLLLALALSSLAFLSWLGIPGGGPVEGPKPVPLVSIGGHANEPSLSPDGNRVVFSWRAPKELSQQRGEDRSGLYIKLVGGDPPQRLTRGAHDRRPAWSPDGRHIAFLRPSGPSSALMLIPAIGGPERTIAEADCDPDFSNLSWTPDARWLVFSARESLNQPYGLWLLSVETGERRRLLTPLPAPTGPAEWPGDFAGALSPDGRTLPFARCVGSWQFQLYQLELSPDFRPQGAPRLVSDQIYNYFNGSTWVSANELLYSAGANCRLWRMRLGGSPRLLNWAPPIAGWPSSSQHRLVYSWFTGRDNLWRWDLRTGACSMIVTSNNWQTEPQYSPDGTSIAFTAYRTDEAEVWKCDADGSDCQQLTFSGGGSPRWSPDGRQLALDYGVGGKAQIAVMPSTGGARRPVTGGNANNRRPSWSHDGKWLYFESDRTGQWRIWKAPLAGGPAVQLSQRAGGAAIESADGRYVYFTAGSAPLYRVPAAGGDEIEIAPRVFQVASFAVTARGVYFMPDERTLHRWDEGSQRIVKVAELARNSVSDGMTVSQDGGHVVFAERDDVSCDIMLVGKFR